MRKFIITLCVCAGYQVALSQELDSIQLKEVVVLSTRKIQPLAEVGKTTYLLTEEDLAKSSSNNVSELLQTLPGIFVTGTFGPEGSTLSYFNRGASSSHTLILLDGKPMNDPSFPSRLTDLRHIPLSIIERVEVLQGGLSTLYGSGASASVINITTKKNQDSGLHGNIGLEAGSFGTYQPSAHLGLKSGNTSNDLHLSHRRSEGFSTALIPDPAVQFDNDGFESWDARISSEYSPSEALILSGGLAYHSFEADYDGGPFFDAANVSMGELLSAFGTVILNSEQGQTQLDFVYTDTDRQFESAFPAAYAGREVNTELRHTFSLGDFEFLAGAVYRSQSATDPYAELELGSEINQLFDGYLNSEWRGMQNFKIHGGLRTHSHSEYGTYLLYHINPVFYKEGANHRFKAFANYSNSYLAPSLSQLYSPWGSASLIPETTKNAEISLLFGIQNLEISLTAFNRVTNNFIAYGYFNEGGAFVPELFNLEQDRKVSGVEAYLKWTGKLFTGNISFSNAVSNDNDHLNADLPALLRVPSNQWKALAGWNVTDALTIGLQYQFISPRTDFDWTTFATVELEPYHLLGARVNYSWKSFTVTGRAGNLLDTDFQNLLGYQTRGRNFTVGVGYNF